MLHVPVGELPGIVITELKHMAVPNPEFHRKQAMRLSTFDTPRLITSFEDDQHELRLLRGLTDEAVALLEDAGFRVPVGIGAESRASLNLTFAGDLRGAARSRRCAPGVRDRCPRGSSGLRQDGHRLRALKGRVVRQLGRITRGQLEGSVPALVHDYCDKDVPLLDRMYGRRRHVMAWEGIEAGERAATLLSRRFHPVTAVHRGP